MKKKRILLGCPTSEYKSYCQSEWIKSLKQFESDEYILDILIVDNSKTIDNAKIIKSLLSELGLSGKFEVVYYNPRNEDIRTFILNSRLVIRDRFIKGKYDYYFSLESDLFAPPNTISKLLSFNEKVIGCNYFTQLRNGHETTMLWFSGVMFGGAYEHDGKQPLESFIDFGSDEVVPAYQNGLGCMLIHKSVILSTPFRMGTEHAKAGAFDDFYFHIDLKKNGYQAYCYTGIIPRHENSIEGWNSVFREENVKLK